MSTATIDSIGRRWRDNPDDCYREGLSEWLKSGERSWRDLTEALCSPTVDFSDLAITVTEKKPLKGNQKCGPHCFIIANQIKHRCLNAVY